MAGFLLSLIALIVTLGILVTIHEFGHFWVARRNGVKVLRFCVGFGQPLYTWYGRDGVEYVVAAIPLGGYVRMLDEREAPVPEAQRAQAFNTQTVKVRAAIVAAGPVANLLLAALFYWVVYQIGVQAVRPLLDAPRPNTPAAQAGFAYNDEIISVGGRDTPTLDSVVLNLLDQALAGEPIHIQVRDAEQRLQERVLQLDPNQQWDKDGARILERVGLMPWRPDTQPVIGGISSGGAAERAGLKVGDKLLQVDGQLLPTWNVWVDYVRQHPGQTLQLELERDGQPQSVRITPDTLQDPILGKIGRIGAGTDMPEQARERLRVELSYGPWDAFTLAVNKTWDMSVFTLRMLGRMVVGQASLENLSGPLSIAQYAGQSASYGLVPFLTFLALVSVSLGVLNLLPIPVLDGGHLLYYLIELVQGRPVSDNVQLLGQRLGVAVLVALMSVALFNDFARFLR